MLTRRLILCGIVLASFGSACTAIVLGKVSDTDDYKTVPSLGSSSGNAIDRCSLTEQADANACSTCIAASCTTEVAYACQPDGATTDYFSTLQNCAENPWNGFSPPKSGASFYGCGSYKTRVQVPNDPGSEAQHKALAGNCVLDNCLTGDAPPCRLCEPSIKKQGTDETALLRDDPCGTCLFTSCAAELSTCCDEYGPMNDFVTKCAYTLLPSNLAACLELGNADPDAGPGRTDDYDDGGTQCLNALKTCFRANCAGKGDCQ